MSSWWAGFILLIALAAGGCRNESTQDGVVILIDADPGLALTRLVVSSETSRATISLAGDTEAQTIEALPLTLLVVRGRGGPRRVEIAGFSGAVEVVRRVAVLQVTRHDQLWRVYLSQDCKASFQGCEEIGKTCSECGNACRDLEVTEPELSVLASDEDPLDSYVRPTCEVDVEDPELDSGADTGPGAGDPDGSPGLNDAGDGGPDFGEGAGLAGPAALVAGYCKPVLLTRTTQTESQETFALTLEGFAGAHRLASDPSCEHPIDSLTLPSGQTEGTFFLEVAPLAQDEARAALTVRARSQERSVSLALEIRRAAVQVAMAGHGGCAVLDDGNVYCWGDNADSILGTDAPFAPVPIGAEHVAKVSASAQLVSGTASFALLDQGTLSVWGANYAAQLGQGSISNSGLTTPVVPVNMGSGVTQVSASGEHLCAVKNGDGYCWGANTNHESGSVDDETILAPRHITELEPDEVAEIGAGTWHACARLTTGVVKCWGRNGAGESGPNAVDYSGTPALVPLPGPATRIFVREHNSCAMVSGAGEDKLYCWGGLFSANPTFAAGAVTGIDDVEFAPSWSMCLRAGGSLYCRGQNEVGELGTGTTLAPTVTLTRLAIPGQVSDFSLNSGSQLYALLGGAAIADGLIYTWGLDDGPRLGLSTLGLSAHAPTRSTMFEAFDVAQLSLHPKHACAIETVSGGVSCWGWGSWGELGLGGSEWSPQAFGLSPRKLPSMASGVTALAAGYEFRLMVRNGKLWATGRDSYGQLGRGQKSDTPVTVPTLASVLPSDGTVTGVGAGQAHACATVRGGTSPGLYCWGSDIGGELGDAAKHTDDLSVTPVRVYDGTVEIDAISTASQSNCVVIDGGVRCWGAFNGSNIPLDVSGLAPGEDHGVVDVEIDSDYACARTDSGAVWCWDRNGLLVDTALTGVTHVGVGDYFACALKDAQVWCWNGPERAEADNAFGQLGQGDTVERVVPTLVSTLVSPVTLLAVAEKQACARDAEGWKCWGNQQGHAAGLTPWIVATPKLIAGW